MDFGGLLVLGIMWLVFSLLGRARGDPRTRPPAAPRVPQPRQQQQPARAPGGLDSTQREGSRLDQLLRELERNLDQVGGRVPSPPLPDDEDVEERETLEVEPRVISLETEVHRPERIQYSQDAGAEELVRRRIASAEARSGKTTKADHKVFDERIRQEPADHTAVRRYTRAKLRDAVVWREILGPPVSERGPRNPG